MTDLTPPPQLTPDEIGRFTALCAELEEAAENNDGDRAAAILGRIREVHPLLSKFMAEGIVEKGFANLSERMGQDDLRAYAIVRDLQAKFVACAPEAPVTDATTATEADSRGTVWAVTAETPEEWDGDADMPPETFVRVDDIAALAAVHRAAGATVEMGWPFGSDGTGIPIYMHVWIRGGGGDGADGIVTYRRANPGESDL